MKKLAKQVGSAKKQTMGSKLSYIKKNWQLYVFFLMPALLLTIIFKYLPMGGLLIAFEDYNVIKGVLGSPWVGLEYFQRFLSSPDFMNYLLNTLKLSIFGLLWSFPIPIILALLLNRIRKAGIKKKIQLLIYAPNFISVIVLCGMVRMFLSPVGPLNRLLGMNTNWMTMPSAFRTIYIASGIWQGAGWAIHHVYCSIIQCKQGTGRGSHCGRCKSFAADLVCGTSGNQGYYRDPVYFTGRKHYEHRL